MICGPPKEEKRFFIFFCQNKEKKRLFGPLERGSLKFNVDGAVRGKLGPTGIGGVLGNYKWKVFSCSLSMPVLISTINELNKKKSP